MSDQRALPADPDHAQRPARRGRVALVLWLALAALALAGCNNLPTFGTFTPITKQEHDAYSLYQGLTIAAMVIGGFVWVLIFWCVIRYRRTRHQAETGSLPKQTRYNIKWEAAYTITPIILVIGIFAYTVIAEDQADQVVKHPDLNVAVTAFRWGWRFDYALPQGKHITVLPGSEPAPTSQQATTGEQAQAQVVSYPTMVLPVDRTVEISLVSNDVVHGFYVPQFEFSRYALPGVTNRFDFTPTRTGMFTGRCTQYCGVYHTQMQFFVQVLSQPAYQAWVHKNETSVNQGPVA
ncbi:MAG: cytochrome c oxidase subunit II [Acidimicrobiales bacterium]